MRKNMEFKQNHKTNYKKKQGIRYDTYVSRSPVQLFLTLKDTNSKQKR